MLLRFKKENSKRQVSPVAEQTQPPNKQIKVVDAPKNSIQELMALIIQRYSSQNLDNYQILDLITDPKYNLTYKDLKETIDTNYCLNQEYQGFTLLALILRQHNDAVDFIVENFGDKIVEADLKIGHTSKYWARKPSNNTYSYNSDIPIVKLLWHSGCNYSISNFPNFYRQDVNDSIKRELLERDRFLIGVSIMINNYSEGSFNDLLMRANLLSKGKFIHAFCALGDELLKSNRVLPAIKAYSQIPEISIHHFKKMQQGYAIATKQLAGLEPLSLRWSEMIKFAFLFATKISEENVQKIAWMYFKNSNNINNAENQKLLTEQNLADLRRLTTLDEMIELLDSIKFTQPSPSPRPRG